MHYDYMAGLAKKYRKRAMTAILCACAQTSHFWGSFCSAENDLPAKTIISLAYAGHKEGIEYEYVRVYLEKMEVHTKR